MSKSDWTALQPHPAPPRSMAVCATSLQSHSSAPKSPLWPLSISSGLMTSLSSVLTWCLSYTGFKWTPEHLIHSFGPGIQSLYPGPWFVITHIQRLRFEDPTVSLTVICSVAPIWVQQRSYGQRGLGDILFLFWFLLGECLVLVLVLGPTGRTSEPLWWDTWVTLMGHLSPTVRTSGSLPSPPNPTGCPWQANLSMSVHLYLQFRLVAWLLLCVS